MDFLTLKNENTPIEMSAAGIIFKKFLLGVWLVFDMIYLVFDRVIIEYPFVEPEEVTALLL
ncbi:MAG: hypothetical protein A2W85_13235 [Bacteroidetes bacterium GWF2_41_31]|nr:MAG: hypothetical protein A2W85_13235 [Bacteroidetes bacterium GWF2_41_31]OFZ02288.1 MAG: hypothetical protein A2338_04910 [Bacteroidetes bacterium RIFOXYB12_FULL_41_6]